MVAISIPRSGRSTAPLPDAAHNHLAARRVAARHIASRTLIALVYLSVLATPSVADDMLLFGLRNFFRDQPSDRTVDAPSVQAASFFEPWGAERYSQEDDIPRIPEPMVFDLVRPLGARRGEVEVNVLALVPLGRSTGGTSTLPDPLGLVPRSPDRRNIEWAPEIEAAIFDGFAIEFELPFEKTTLEAYKAASQLTFGTFFDNHAIHGAQMIVLHDRHVNITTPSFLYLLGVRMDPTWSFLGMVGFRTEIGAPSDFSERTEQLVNLSLFADVSPRMTLGFESNFAGALNGESTLFVIPQVHWEITDHTQLQWGFGVDFTTDYTMPEFGARLIRSR